MLLLFCKRQPPELVERMRTSTPKQGPLCVLCFFVFFVPDHCVYEIKTRYDRPIRIATD
jgi:hypothetical protein